MRRGRANPSPSSFAINRAASVNDHWTRLHPHRFLTGFSDAHRTAHLHEPADPPPQPRAFCRHPCRYLSQTRPSSVSCLFRLHDRERCQHPAKDPDYPHSHLPRHIVQLRQPNKWFRSPHPSWRAPQHMPLHIIGGRIGVTSPVRCLPPGRTRLTRILCGPIPRRCLHEPYQPSLGGHAGPGTLVPCNLRMGPDRKMEPPSWSYILAAAVVIVR